MRTPVGRLVFGLAVVLASVPAEAYFLDNDRNFDVRLRAYTQLGIMATHSEKDWGPHNYSVGDLAQHRNFYNPELDAKLTDYTRWMPGAGLSLLSPDDLKFRFAWWGFYDGLYDYLNGPWNENRRELRARFSQAHHPYASSFFFADENKNPRHIYASRNRINELYVDYTKGRFFFRLGRQAISWGESDTIALLDLTNNFDLTQAAPGFFQDVDEARIPFYALRSTVKVADSWGPMSSLFVDSYIVPGPIDTTVPINPLTGGVSPFGPDVGDPQAQVAATNKDPVITGSLCNAGAGDPRNKPFCRLQIATVDRNPANTWSNTRWGVRLTSVVARDYTVQGWFFRTFNQAPTPLLTSPGPQTRFANGLNPTLVDKRGARCKAGEAGCQFALPIVTILERRLESVIGLATTWFSPMVDGIIRTEAELFLHELAFIPSQNLNARGEIPATVPILNVPVDPDPITGKRFVHNSIPTANYLRFSLGYDRFFFFRPLNPSNSFVLSTAFNGSINLTERRGMDFRNPNQKPGAPAQATAFIPGSPLCSRKALGALAPALRPALEQLCVVTPPHNFEDAYKFEGFLQTALQTDYLHGKLEPRMVVITDISGIFGFAPTATYRFTDNFLGTVTYLVIESSRRAGLGTFRAHDMVQLRLTYQLN